VVLDFASLGSGNVQAISGTVALGIGNSGIAPAALTFNGSFAIAKQTDAVNPNLTRILIGLSNVTAFIGSSDQQFGLSLTDGQLGLLVLRDAGAATTTYALSASGTISPVGLPADLTLTINASARINTTGGAVEQTIVTPGGSVNLSLPSSSTLREFSGTATFKFGSFATLSGNFALQA